jgi:YjbE family integral membrane protein
LQTPDRWDALGPVLQICLIDLLLSGDNALVIALACRGLPPRLWRRAVSLGTTAAIVLRILLTAFAALVLTVPYLKMVGAVLLLVVAVRLLNDGPPRSSDLSATAASQSVWRAMATIVTADTVMSLDNVLAVAAAARGSLALLVFGLVLSIPILIFGSVLVARLLERFPILVLAGSAQLGWVAGATAAADPAVVPWLSARSIEMELTAPLLGTLFVLLAWLLDRDRRRKRS